MAAEQRKRKLTKKQVDAIKPTIKEFNSISKTFIRLLGLKVQQKERKINVMVSRIAKPGTGKRNIDIRNVDVTRDFLKKHVQSQNRSNFGGPRSSGKGFII